MRVVLLYTLFLFFVALNLSCEENINPFIIDYSDVPALPDTTAQGVTKVSSESGLIYYVVAEGDTSSLQVVIRDNIEIFYSVRIETGEIIESSYANGSTQPSRFLNIGSYASDRGTNSKGSGFVEGILGMREGERRVMVLPSELNQTNASTLIYDIELETIEY